MRKLSWLSLLAALAISSFSASGSTASAKSTTQVVNQPSASCGGSTVRVYVAFGVHNYYQTPNLKKNMARGFVTEVHTIDKQVFWINWGMKAPPAFHWYLQNGYTVVWFLWGNVPTFVPINGPFPGVTKMIHQAPTCKPDFSANTVSPVPTETQHVSAPAPVQSSAPPNQGVAPECLSAHFLYLKRINQGAQTFEDVLRNAGVTGVQVIQALDKEQLCGMSLFNGALVKGQFHIAWPAVITTDKAQVSYDPNFSVNLGGGNRMITKAYTTASIEVTWYADAQNWGQLTSKLPAVK